MLDKFKQIPKPIIFGQTIFLITIIYFVISVSSGTPTNINNSLYGIAMGCIIGVLTSLIPRVKEWKYIVFDIVATALIYTAYVEVFSFT